jgi:hypothetical protein
VRPVEIHWAPWPHRAAFCITDDTDTAELATVRAVYDALEPYGVRATKTVWAFRPAEPCGIPPLPPSIQRGVTLEDAEYLDYCRELDRRGHEIALHGATAGNNRRETVVAAFDRMARHFRPAATYVCHAKNADNPYWQEKTVARGPLRWLLAAYARGHRCSGEDPASPYFWGDLCRERIRYIRLLRTTRVDTLSANPSMPYHEAEKPFVPYWFSATKRSFRDCTAPGALDALERSGGACVLYQYLCRYADPAGGVTPAFRAGLERLAARGAVWVDTAGAVLDRLRRIHAVWVASRGRDAWLANAGDEDVTGLQLVSPAPGGPLPDGVHPTSDGLRVERLPARSLLPLRFAEPVAAAGRRAIALDPRLRGRAGFGHGTVFVNAGAEEWRSGRGREVPPHTVTAEFAPGLERLRPFSRAGDAELSALFAAQAAILLREFLFKGRPVDSGRWLAQDTIALEDHDRW